MAPIKFIWQAITNSMMMKEWHFSFAEDFKLETGTVFEWMAGDTINKQWLHHGKILEIIPNKKLMRSWEFSSYSGSSALSCNHLEVNNNTTKVILTHQLNIAFDNSVIELGKENFEMGLNHIINICLAEYLNKISTL
jgi:uncharacterized protein YndB with AHSA1/START domain